MLRLSWLISIGISLLGFLIVGNLFNAKDGDFGFIGIIFVIPFLLLSMFITFRYYYVLSNNATMLSNIIGLVAGVIIIGILSYYEIDFKNNVLNSNENNYSIYINFYTFALIHSISAVFGGVWGLFSNSKEKEHTT